MDKKIKTVLRINSITIGLIIAQLWIDFGFAQFIKYGLPFAVLAVTNGLVLLELMRDKKE